MHSVTHQGIRYLHISRPGLVEGERRVKTVRIPDVGYLILAETGS